MFDVIETSELDIVDIAPRIKVLNDSINILQEDKNNLNRTSQQKELPKFTEKELKPYVRDIQKTLKLGSIVEQKTFIRSFIKKIWIDYPTVTIEYTIPLNKFNNANKEVLVIAKNGGPIWTRTRDLILIRDAL